MRKLLLVGVSATLAVAGCAHAPPLRPAIPEQVVPGDARAATAEVAGVRVTIRADDFGGWIGDLEDAATPVAITVENDSGMPIRVRPRLFALIGPTGFRYEPLDRHEVRALVRSHEGYGYYGYPGFYPWFYGGFGGPWWGWPGAYPFFGWGMYWAPPPAAPPSARAGTRQPSGILQDGGDIDLLLFYPVPAGKLDSALVQATLVAQDGTRLGLVQLPFVRGKAAPPPMAGAARPPEQSGVESQPGGPGTALPPPPEAKRAQKPAAPTQAQPPAQEKPPASPPGAQPQAQPGPSQAAPPPPPATAPQPPPSSEAQPPPSQPVAPAPQTQ